MADNILQTDADKLLNLVVKEKRIKASNAAEKLKLDIEQVINLGEILEEDELIKLHYPPVGEPILLHKSQTKKTEEKTEDAKRPKKSKAGLIKIGAIAAAGLFLLGVILYKRNPKMFSSLSAASFSEYYLDTNAILIIATAFAVIIIIILMLLLKMKKKKAAANKLKGKRHGKNQKEERGKAGHKAKKHKKRRKLRIVKALKKLFRKPKGAKHAQKPKSKKN